MRARFKRWWKRFRYYGLRFFLPRTLVDWIGFIALALGVAYYLPLPTLPIPRLIALHADLAPELIGIGITVLVINQAVRGDRKAQLIRQFGTKYRDVTEMARVELEHEEWLYDGSLSGAKLWWTNLSEAVLDNADLSEAVLAYANLSEAHFVNTNLSEAHFPGANLSGAKLMYANLSGARLSGADLNGASFEEANLSKADLSGADLNGAVLRYTDLSGANLSGIRNWTTKQLKQGGTGTLDGAILPEGFDHTQ